MCDNETKLADDDDAAAKLKDNVELVKNCEYDSKVGHFMSVLLILKFYFESISLMFRSMKILMTLYVSCFTETK